jgi:D-3-phosphoglycerate dehydrogenase / 2-oxoglutarate reductase
MPAERVLIIGGGIGNVRKAVAQGFGAVCLQQPWEYTPELASLADAAFLVDLSDWSVVEPIVTAAHKAYGFSRVVTTGQAGVEVAGRISDLLGLGGVSYDIAPPLRGRLSVREHLARVGATTVPAAEITDRAGLEAFGAAHGDADAAQAAPAAPPSGDRPRVVVLDPVSPGALTDLERDHEVMVRLHPGHGELLGLAADADALVVRSGVTVTGDVIRAGRRLKVVARAGSGTDNIDLAACRAAGVQVFNLPGVSASSVAELAIGLLLSVTRNIALADRQVRAGLWNKPQLAGPGLQDRVLGVVGLGPIGSRIARLGSALGMKVLAAVDRPTPERDEELRGRGTERVGLRELLGTADMVCLAVPLTERTRNLIGAEELALMSTGSFLVNVSRGGVVDEDALLRALKDGGIAGAALDVHGQESGTPALTALDNVVLTPHIGATTTDTQDRVGRLLTEELRTVLAGGRATNRVC